MVLRLVLCYDGMSTCSGMCVVKIYEVLLRFGSM